MQLPFTVPFNTMFTSDYIDEMQQDVVLPSSGILSFADLGLPEPKRVSSGLPIDHLRHYRVGGYDLGTTSQSASTGGAGFN